MGWTRKPCEGCQGLTRRTAGELCRRCKRVMAAGHEAVRFAASDEDVVVTAISGNAGWAGMPRILDSGQTLWRLTDARIDRDSIGPLLLDFFRTLGTPQQAVNYNDKVAQVPTGGGTLQLWLSSRESTRGPDRRMRRETAERITGVVNMIALQLEYAHCLGYHAGASLLRSLASGDLTEVAGDSYRTKNDDRLVKLAAAINGFDPVESLRTPNEKGS